MHRRTHGRVRGEYDPHNPRHRVPFFVCVRYFSFLVRCEGTGEEKKRGRRTTSGPQRRKAPLVSPLRAPAPLLHFPLPFFVFRSRFSPFFTFQIIQIRVQKGKEKGGKPSRACPRPPQTPSHQRSEKRKGKDKTRQDPTPLFPRPPKTSITQTGPTTPTTEARTAAHARPAAFFSVFVFATAPGPCPQQRGRRTTTRRHINDKKKNNDTTHARHRPDPAAAAAAGRPSPPTPLPLPRLLLMNREEGGLVGRGGGSGSGCLVAAA